MNFRRMFVPDEPLVQDPVVTALNLRSKLPRAVRNWTILSILANGVIAALATAIIRNPAPFVIAILVSLFPAYLSLFWRDVVATTDTVRDQAIQQYPFMLKIIFGVQWIAVSMCLASTLALGIACVAAWSALAAS
jgi:hypothetical protein